MSAQTSRRRILALGGASAGYGLARLALGRVAFAAPGATDFGRLRFGVLSDPHLDIRGIDGHKMGAASVDCVRLAVAALNRQPQLDFVLLLGDLLLDGERENARCMRKLLRRLRAPCFVVAGNHDYAPGPKKRRADFSYMQIEEFVRFFRGFGYDSSGSRYYARRIAVGLRVVGLDACLPGERKWGGVLPDEQLAWLDDQLTRHADELNLIFMHHNLVRWSAEERAGQRKAWFCIDNEERVLALLARHARAAPLVLSGHRHIGLRRRQVRGVHCFVLPALCSHPMRYAVFEIDCRGVTWRTPSVPLPAALHRQAQQNLLADDWWRGEGDAASVLDWYQNQAEVEGEAGFGGQTSG